jgi:hypothetical protein
MHGTKPIKKTAVLSDQFYHLEADTVNILKGSFQISL